MCEERLLKVRCKGPEVGALLLCSKNIKDASKAGAK